MAPLSRAMTVRDVAYMLNISVYTVYRLANSGQLPGFKAGSKWLFNKEQIEAFRNKHYVRKAAGLIACLYFLLS